MTRRRSTLATTIALLAACGPQAGVHGTGTEGGSTDTTAATTTASTSAATTVVTTAPGTTTGPDDSTTSDADGTSSTGGTTGDPDACCDGIPIVIDEPVAEGFSGSEVLADMEARFQNVPLVWNTVSPSSTTVTLTPQRVMQVLDIPGAERCCPCMFLAVPCSGGLEIDVVMGVDTADGFIAGAELVARVEVGYGLGDTTEPRFGFVSTEAVALAEIPGTLADQMFQTRDARPIVPTDVQIRVEWEPDDAAVVPSVFVDSDEGQLGEPPP